MDNFALIVKLNQFKSFDEDSRQVKYIYLLLIHTVWSKYLLYKTLKLIKFQRLDNEWK
jgi:hypothetical protein